MPSIPPLFEIVHTLTDWYDGPRGGIADCNGAPHVYKSEWRDRSDDELEEDSFLLMPIDTDTLAWAVEDSQIFRRWRRAFDEGKVPLATHPALPEDQARHVELTRLLQGRITIDPARAIRKIGRFRRNTDLDKSGQWAGYEVCWRDAE